VKERYEILQKEEKALKQQLASYHDFYETFCLAEEVLLAVFPKEKAPQQFLNALSFFIFQKRVPVEKKTDIFLAIEEKNPKEEKNLTFLKTTKAGIEKEKNIKTGCNYLLVIF
ncbi:V-type ATP synthase subunit I, partial [Enterococcus faecalis]